MYWQVYMHKTVIASESLLVNILRRAKELADKGTDLFATPALRFFLYNKITRDDLHVENLFTPGLIASNFTKLDDSDILVAARYWADSSDPVLADLSSRLMKRNLFAVELQDTPFPRTRVSELRDKVIRLMSISSQVDRYYVSTKSISNLTYAPDATEVKILLKNGSVTDISTVSDMFGQKFVSERITKYVLIYPKECR
jgi:HD superfamily phosphohydrolase